MVLIPVDSLPKTKGPGKEIGRNPSCLSKDTEQFRRVKGKSKGSKLFL